MDNLTLEDLDLILEALKYAKQARQDYKDHPSYEFKQTQVKAVENVEEKVRALKQTLSPTR